MLKRLFKSKPTQETLPKHDQHCAKNEAVNASKNILKFDNFNFKLAILQVLMYDLNVLDTQFDLYEFVDEYSERPIYLQEEGYDIIPEAFDYFLNFEIDADYAQYVSDINMDPMHDIYTHIYPFWDGMDDLFDVSVISHDELAQFQNLKSHQFMGHAVIGTSPGLLNLDPL